MRIVEENGKFALIADPEKVIVHGGGYCDKLYRKVNDFSDCTEMEKPIMEDDEIPDSEALAIITGGVTDA